MWCKNFIACVNIFFEVQLIIVKKFNRYSNRKKKQYPVRMNGTMSTLKDAKA